MKGFVDQIKQGLQKSLISQAPFIVYRTKSTFWLSLCYLSLFFCKSFCFTPGTWQTSSLVDQPFYFCILYIPHLTLHAMPLPFILYLYWKEKMFSSGLISRIHLSWKKKKKKSIRSNNKMYTRNKPQSFLLSPGFHPYLWMLLL